MPAINPLIGGGAGNPTTGTAADLLTGKTLNDGDGNTVNGGMPNIGSSFLDMTSQGQTTTIPKGYHDGTGYAMVRITNLFEDNIKNGVNVGGKIGNFPNSGTAATGDVLSGKTFYSTSAAKLTGAMVDRGAVSYTLTQQGQSYAIASGRHSGAGRVTTNISNLIASNIVNGINVGGIVGTGAAGVYVNQWLLPSAPWYAISDIQGVVRFCFPQISHGIQNPRIAIYIWEGPRLTDNLRCSILVLLDHLITVNTYTGVPALVSWMAGSSNLSYGSDAAHGGANIQYVDGTGIPDGTILLSGTTIPALAWGRYWQVAGPLDSGRVTVLVFK